MRLGVWVLAMVPTVAFAQPQLTWSSIAPTRSVFANVARGETGRMLTIELYPGYPHVLNFSPLNDPIAKVWLSDPSRIVVDFDRRIEDNPNFILLREIEDLDFPGLTRAQTVLLSVVTSGGAYYQFEVLFRIGKPDVTQTVLFPESRGTPLIQLSNLRQARIEHVQRGLEIQAAQVPLDPELRSRVANFVSLVNQGSPLAEASRSAGVSLGFITRLAEIGLNDFVRRRTQLQEEPLDSLPRISQSPESTPEALSSSP